MARVWLHLRPVEDIPPRATADVDLGIDRQGLRLSVSDELVKPLLERLDYVPQPGEEGFRFRKTFGEGEALVVDVFIPKGQSREEPPMLEKDVETLAAPGLAYAMKRGHRLVVVEFVDGDQVTEVELPMPTLDAAFVLKGALAASGVRGLRERRERDRVDSVMLAAACLEDAEAMAALREASNKEAKRAIAWIVRELADEDAAVPLTLGKYLETQFSVPGGAAWSVGIGQRFQDAMKPLHSELDWLLPSLGTCQRT